MGKDTLTVKSTYVQAPYRFSFRDVTIGPPKPGEVLLDVLATGICGFDVEIAHQLAKEPRAIGHEICGRVRAVGAGVTHVKVGDQVALESGSFCGLCADCRNGRVDLCKACKESFWTQPAMGFSDAMIAPARCCVPAEGLDPTIACLAEPCGVALDMVKLAEIGLAERVLVVGVAPIGLMALAMARKKTGSTLVAANPSKGKLQVAKKLGADAVYSTDETTLKEIAEKHGPFHKVLVTAPPQTLPAALDAAAYGGYVVFIGFDWGEGGKVVINTTAMHLGKKQLRASFASPAVYLPEALELLRTGAVPGEEIISHRMPLSRIEEAFGMLRTDREKTRKIVILPDGKF